MKASLRVTVLMAVLAGCATGDPESTPPRLAEELAAERVFEGEIRALVAARSPAGGTPCGGVIVGAADDTVHEWELPAGTSRVVLLLEAERPTVPLRLCLVENDDEAVARGVPPVELRARVDAHRVAVAVMADDASSLPQTPTKVRITAKAFGRTSGE